MFNLLNAVLLHACARFFACHHRSILQKKRKAKIQQSQKKIVIKRLSVDWAQHQQKKKTTHTQKKNGWFNTIHRHFP